jgi:hypothetical protein
MIKTYKQKVDAVPYITKMNKLFSEEYTYTNNQQLVKTFHFIISSYNTIYDKVNSCDKNYYYENIEANDKVKLHIDVDIKITDKTLHNKTYHQGNIDTCINTINTILFKLYQIKYPEIIVLDASTAVKLSAHIIYTTVHFLTIKHLKEFILLIGRDIIADRSIDLNIYRVGCFRTLHSSKINQENKLVLHKIVNPLKKYTDKETFLRSLCINISEDSILANITLVNNKHVHINNKPINISKKVVNKPANNTTLNIEPNIEENSNLLEDAIKCINVLKIERSIDHKSWNSVGLSLYNIQPCINSFKIFQQFSKKAEKKYNRAECVKQWNSFKDNTTKASIYTLRRMAREDDFLSYQAIIFSEYKPNPINFTAIKFEKNYLIDIGNTLESQKDINIVAENTIKWINAQSEDNIISHFIDKHQAQKALAINSTYSTGKTKYLSSIFEEYDRKFTNILIISYRKSLTSEFLHNFDKYGFISYQTKLFEAPRIVCQVESLHKLYDKLTKNLRKYDLVVIDEITSVLHHFVSDTIKYKEETFSILLYIIRNSSKLIVLDGDFGNMAYDFLLMFDKKPVVLENTIQKNKKRFIYIKSESIFINKLEADLGLVATNKKAIKKHNILLICMSSAIAKKYYETYKDKCKTILFCSDSDDAIKNKLNDVENTWNKYQLVIFTPCIESGVNFNKPHFYKQYVILAQQSVSQRGLMQMLGRSRQFESYDVNVYLNNFRFNVINNLYTFDEMVNYQDHVKSKNPEKCTLEYDIINAHNLVEENNKCKMIFVAHYITICLAKGCTYEFNDDEGVKLGKSTHTTDLMNIKNAKLISHSDANHINGLIYQRVATEEQKIQFKKYLYATIWNIYTQYNLSPNEVKFDDDFFDRYYGKAFILFNLRKLLDVKKASGMRYGF